MESFDIKNLKQRAGESLASADCNPKKLILLYTSVMLAASLLIALVNLLLSKGMEGGGGLDAFDSRAMLETVSSVLQLAHMCLLPFWQIGLVALMLQLLRGQKVGAASLLEGFRHFGPVLRVNLLRGVICFLVIMLASQVGSFVYLMTPLANQFNAMMEESMASGVLDPDALMNEEIINELLRTCMPVMLVVVLVALIPVAYRLRMMDYAIMDRPELGARFALQMSLFMTRKRCKKLFMLDLSFWWFYALELLVLTVGYADLLLPLVGVELGMDAQLASILFLLASLVLQLGLYVWKQDALAATYAAAYEALLPPPLEEEA